MATQQRRNLLGLVALMAIAVNSGRAADAAPGIAVSNIAVVDVEKGVVISNQTVLIRGQRIVGVGPANATKIPHSFTVIPAANKYLMPGLWDMHVHLAGLSAEPAWSKQLLLPLLVANGVTGVRDMGGDLNALKSWRQEIQAGKIIGPQIVAAGPMLDADAFDDNVRVVATPAQAEPTVAAVASQGADFVKVLSGLSRESYIAILQAASKHNLEVAGHVPLSLSLEEASQRGQRTIEHILYSNFIIASAKNEAKLREQLTAAYQSGKILDIGKVLDDAELTYDPQRAAMLWGKLKKNGTFVAPTLVSVSILASMDELLAADPNLDYLPEKLRLAWSKDRLGPRFTPEKLAWYRKELARELKIVAELQRAGVMLLAGSDSLDPHDVPGQSLHRELELLVAAGLTPAQALRIATRNPAILLHKEREMGAAAPGAFADLLLLDANPLEEISSTRRIYGVFLGGKFLDRAQLDGLQKGVGKKAGEIKP